MDAALAELGLKRRVVGSVATFPASLFIVRDTDPVGLEVLAERPGCGAWGR